MGWKDGLEVRVHTAFAEDWSIVPRTITTTSKFSSWIVCVHQCICMCGANASGLCEYLHVCTHTHTIKKIKNVKNKTLITREACPYGGTRSDAPWSLILC